MAQEIEGSVDGLEHLRAKVAELDWPLLLIRIPPETMDRFRHMTKDVEGGELEKFQFLMSEAGWGE